MAVPKGRNLAKLEGMSHECTSILSHSAFKLTAAEMEMMTIKKERYGNRCIHMVFLCITHLMLIFSSRKGCSTDR